MKFFTCTCSPSASKNGEKGFTLIELLVVVSILGVLSAVAIPNVGSMIASGNVAAANAELASVQTAISAAMANSRTMTFTGPVSSTSPGNPSIAPFIAGSNTILKGVYIVGTSGMITSATTTLSGAVWNATLHQFD